MSPVKSSVILQDFLLKACFTLIFNKKSSAYLQDKIKKGEITPMFFILNKRCLTKFIFILFVLFAHLFLAILTILYLFPFLPEKYSRKVVKNIPEKL